MFTLMFSDLTEEAQARFLANEHLSSPEEGNYDVLPIFEFDEMEDEDEQNEISG